MLHLLDVLRVVVAHHNQCVNLLRRLNNQGKATDATMCSTIRRLQEVSTCEPLHIGDGRRRGCTVNDDGRSVQRLVIAVAYQPLNHYGLRLGHP